jgi:hypothetical protein
MDGEIKREEEQGLKGRGRGPEGRDGEGDTPQVPEEEIEIALQKVLKGFGW